MRGAPDDMKLYVENLPSRRMRTLLLCVSISLFCLACQPAPISTPQPSTPIGETPADISKRPESDGEAAPKPHPETIARLLPESRIGAPEKDLASRRLEYNTLITSRSSAARQTAVWQYRMTRQGQIVGFEFSNYGGNRILPPRRDALKNQFFTRDFQFRFDERARQDIHSMPRRMRFAAEFFRNLRSTSTLIAPRANFQVSNIAARESSCASTHAGQTRGLIIQRRFRPERRHRIAIKGFFAINARCRQRTFGIKAARCASNSPPISISTVFSSPAAASLCLESALTSRCSHRFNSCRQASFLLQDCASLGATQHGNYPPAAESSSGQNLTFSSFPLSVTPCSVPYEPISPPPH